MPAHGVDSILTATAAATAAGRPPDAPAAPDPGRRSTLRRRARLLLAAAALVLAAWLGASAVLHVRAQRERSRTTAMLRADRELTELSTLRWRTLLGAIAAEDALTEGTPIWHRLARAIAETDDPVLQDRLTVMAARLQRTLPAPIPARPSRLAIAGDAVGAAIPSSPAGSSPSSSAAGCPRATSCSS
jgi:hypothetical protein